MPHEDANASDCMTRVGIVITAGPDGPAQAANCIRSNEIWCERWGGRVSPRMFAQ